MQVNPLSEALDCLKALEWSATADAEQGGTVSACPWCDRTEAHGIHDAHCKLAALIDARREDEPDDHPADGRFTR